MDQDLLVKVIMDEINKVLKNSPEKCLNKTSVVVFEDNEKLDVYKSSFGLSYDVVGYDKNIKDCSIVVIPLLCLKALGNIANLSPSNDEEHFIIKMLMKGRQVYALEDGLLYKKYKVSAPKQLYNKYLEFEKQLTIYGVKIVSTIYEIVNNNSYSVDVKATNVMTELSSDSEKVSDIINKKLITESDIVKRFVNGYRTVVIANNSMITPLAQDFIRTNKIKIVRSNGV